MPWQSGRKITTGHGVNACGKCGKSFSSKQSLVRHSNKKTPCDVVLKCGKCNKVFTRQSNLKRHLNRKTDCSLDVNALIVVHPCNLCNTVIRPSNLARHLKTCRGELDLHSKMDEMSKQIEQLRKQCARPQDVKNEADAYRDLTVNNTINIVNNINVNLVQFDGQNARESIRKIVAEREDELIQILSGGLDEPATDFNGSAIISVIIELVTFIHRNEDYLGMFNVFCPEYNTTDLVVYSANGWVSREYQCIARSIYQKIYDATSSLHRRATDKTGMYKHLFALFHNSNGQLDSAPNRLSVSEIADLSSKMRKVLDVGNIKKTKHQLIGIDSVINTFLLEPSNSVYRTTL
jgi:uncharacterized C2H2 Zn-finger protein